MRVYDTNFTFKMQFTQTYSRAKLQGIPAERRLQAIANHVEWMQQQVIDSAAIGKSSYLHTYPPKGATARCCTPGHYVPTRDDIIEGLKIKFPDCDISYVEEWIDVCPGHREQRSGIKIDWS